MSGDSPIGGVDYGNTAARWLEKFIERPNARLVLVSPDVALRHLVRKSEQGNMDAYYVCYFTFSNQRIKGTPYFLLALRTHNPQNKIILTL